MPQGNIIKLAGEFTDDSLPRYYPNDSWIDAGTMMLKDFGKVASWPTLGVPANGAAVLDLVTGAPNGSITNVSGQLGYREGGIDFIATTSSNQKITLGTVNADFSLFAAGSPDFVVIFWAKRETGFSTASYQNLLSRALNTSAATYEIGLNAGAAGDTIRFGVSNGTTDQIATLGGAALTAYQALLNTTVQIAGIYEAGNVKLCINGAVVGTAGGTLAKPLNNYTAQPLVSGYGAGGSGPFKGIVKRIGITKLGYGKTGIERVLQDYNSNKVRLQTP